MRALLIGLLTSTALIVGACGGGSSSAPTTTTGTVSPPPLPPPPPPPPTGESKSHCPDQITAGSNMGIAAIPSGSNSSYTNNFCKYTQLLAPNGKHVRFFAQNLVTNEQMVRARNILEFYLTNVAGSEYGGDKSDILNQMANNNATLIMPNGSDTGDAPADGQTLFQSENVVEGSAAYLVNDPRDAAFEEILHLVHDTGIGVDGTNSQPGVRAGYQAEIRTAMRDAIAPGIITGGAQTGLWGAIDPAWLRELRDENSLTQEYLASIIDTYYGLAGESTAGGSNDLYKPQTRDQIRTMDTKGWALVGANSPRKFFSEYVTYEARVDADYTGVFTLIFDANTLYTHKSQYLLNVTLTGGQSTNLIGNAQSNTLMGNDGNNVIEGGEGDDTLAGGKGDDNLDGGTGTDIVVFSGSSTEYAIMRTNGSTIVTDNTADRDGKDTLTNVEILQFSDGQQQN